MGYRDGLGHGWRVGAKALARMIDESSGDAHRWLDVLLDLQDARTTLDATRAKLAEVERERDEMRKECEAWETGGRMAPLTIARVALEAQQTTERALAASQAECARLREAMRTASERARLSFYMEAHILLERALASAPGSTDALREVCERVGEKAWVAGVEAYKAPPPDGITDRDGFNDYVLSSIAAIVSRILGERSDDAPHGRGERAKEDGDA